MKCEEILNILSDYVDGELPEAQCAEIKEHMKACSHCREFVETFRKSLDLTHKLDHKHPPENVCESVLRAIRKEILDK